MNYDPTKLRTLINAALTAQEEYTRHECQSKAWKTSERSAEVSRAYIAANIDLDNYLKVGEE